MQTNQATGIDLDFRPKSYFWPTGLETHLLVAHQGRRAQGCAEASCSTAGRPEEIPDFLAGRALTSAERQALGRIHPAFMGGEYLPDLAQTETMIARITIASTTQDVTCVYARRGKGRIYYRVVDEYEGETLSGEEHADIEPATQLCVSSRRSSARRGRSSTCWR